jgi:hypothetical protein
VSRTETLLHNTFAPLGKALFRHTLKLRQTRCRVGKGTIATVIESHVVSGSPRVPIHGAARIAFPVAFRAGGLGAKKFLNLLLHIGAGGPSWRVRRNEVWV